MAVMKRSVLIGKKEHEVVSKSYESLIKSFDDENLILEHFISTEQVDRSKDRVFADGVMFDGVPVVLKQHGFDTDTGKEPIAKPLAISVGVNDKGVKGILVKTQYFNGKGLTPPDNTGERLYLKAKESFMPYWSIGYGIVEAGPNEFGGRDIKKCFVYEYSQVGVPDNIGAEVIKAFDGEMLVSQAKELFSFEIKAETKELPKPAFTSIEKVGDILEEAKSKDTPTIVDNMAIIDLDKYSFFEKDSKMEKSIADRVATEIPWEAIRSIWWAMVDELCGGDGSKESTKIILDELITLITPYAQALNLATTSGNGGIIKEAIKIEMKEKTYNGDKGRAFPEPVPDTVVDPKPEPNKLVKALLDLKSAKTGPTVKTFPFSKTELVSTIGEAVKVEMKKNLAALTGKVDV